MGSIPIIPTFMQTWRNGLAHRISNPTVKGSSPFVCTCSVAQLVRAGSSYGQGREFESHYCNLWVYSITVEHGTFNAADMGSNPIIPIMDV